MKKELTRLSGRAFMCVGIDADEEDFMHYNFKTGDRYYEVEEDIDGVNLCSNEQILLNIGNDLSLYANASSFALMLDETDYLTETIKIFKNENEQRH